MEFKTTSSRAGRPVAVLCIIAVILQLALAPQLSLFGGRFNFMLVLTAVLAVSGDPPTLVYVGFGAGLFYDLTGTGPVGLMALLLTLSGYGAAALSRGIAPGANMEALRTVGVLIVLVNLVYGLALFFMGVQTSLLYALGVHGLASSVLDLLAAALMLTFAPVGEYQGRGFSAGRGMPQLGGVRTARGTRGRNRGTRFKGMR